MTTYGAFAAIYDAAGRILLVRHAYKEKAWGQPGGRIEDGELPADAVRREVLEETGLRVTEARLMGIYVMPFMDDIVFHFACKVEGELIEIPNDEIAERAYFGVAELPEQLRAVTRVRISDAFMQKSFVARLIQDPDGRSEELLNLTAA